jgi:hypothetical protein
MRAPARTAKSRMSIRCKFDKSENALPILGDLVKERRGAATRREAGLEAGVGGHVILDIENHFSAKREEIELLCRWVGVQPEKVQTPPPILHRSFGPPRHDGADVAPILEAILSWLAEGGRLSKFESIPLQCDSRRAKKLVTKYLRSNPEFAAAYHQMKALGAHHLVEECLDISDDPTVGTMQMQSQIKTRLWIAGKLNPAVYGNNSENNVNINVGFGDALEQLEKRREARSLPAPDLKVIDIEPLPLQRADEGEGSIVSLASD